MYFLRYIYDSLHAAVPSIKNVFNLSVRACFLTVHFYTDIFLQHATWILCVYILILVGYSRLQYRACM